MSPRRLALVILGLGLVCGCAKPRPTLDEVVFWEPWPEAIVAPLVRRFEAENPGLHVRIRHIGLESVGDSVVAARSPGAWPDLCALPGGEMPRWLDSGALSDWSAGVASLRDSLHGWPLCTVGDALYGLPWMLSPHVLVFDRELFARAGLDSTAPPQTWTQLRAAATRIQKLGHGVHGFGIARPDSLGPPAEFLSFAWGNGGDVLSAGLDSSRLDSPQNLAALEFLVSVRRASLVAGIDTLRREFHAGRLGMMLEDAPRLAPAAEGPARTPGLALVPQPDLDRGEPAAFAKGVVLVSFTGSHRKEAALRLARLLVRPGEQLALARALQPLQPALAGADTSEGVAGDPALRVLARQCATAHFAPASARWDSIRIALAGAVGEALAGRRTPREALAGAGARATELAGRK